MSTPVPISLKSLSDYEQHIGEAGINEILRLAEPLRGCSVLHFNATSFGGGVAEILSSLVPLLQDLGIEAEWQVMDAPSDFFDVTKTMHNGMQGMRIPWTKSMVNQWVEANRAHADSITGKYDFVYVHDPQPAGVLHYLQQRDRQRLGAKWIWRCHLDTTDAVPVIWDFLRGFVESYDAMVFTLAEYVKEPIRGPQLEVIWPAIDPNSPKNSDISTAAIRDTLANYRIDAARPLIAQISRFDPWKDPLGVIDVYRLLKEDLPDLQLLMVASMAHDDPEAWSVYDQLALKADGDPDIHILSNLDGVADAEVNAFQRAAQVVLQKSIREGFGLVVSEALWKAKAFVGSRAGGIPLQLNHGEAGRLAGNTQQFADEIGRLLHDGGAREQLGILGKERVRAHFLTTRLLRDHLRLLNKLRTDGRRKHRPGPSETELRLHDRGSRGQ